MNSIKLCGPCKLCGILSVEHGGGNCPTETSIEKLVNNFLTWPVPADVYPDGTPGKPGRTGTNLLTAIQAEEMLRHVLGCK